jgi:hypothetical protein
MKLLPVHFIDGNMPISQAHKILKENGLRVNRKQTRMIVNFLAILIASQSKIPQHEEGSSLHQG